MMRGDHFGKVNFSGMAIIFCDDEGRSFWESQFFGNSDRFLWWWDLERPSCITIFIAWSPSSYWLNLKTAIILMFESAITLAFKVRSSSHCWLNFKTAIVLAVESAITLTAESAIHCDYFGFWMSDRFGFWVRSPLSCWLNFKTAISVVLESAIAVISLIKL